MSTTTVVPQTENPSTKPDLWVAALYLVCDLQIELQSPGFTVRDLLQLGPGSLVSTNRKQGASVPLTVNGQLIAWTEFEVLGDRLAIRLMELV